jgi:hypothetical protein
MYYGADQSRIAIGELDRIGQIGPCRTWIGS